jgi:hypothetical protein
MILNLINIQSVKILRIYIGITSIAVISLTTSCDIHDHQHGAHVHGEAQLSIILDDPNTLVAEFKSPAHAIIGFEHAPGNAEEKNKSERILKELESNFNSYISTDADLKCRLDSAKAEPLSSAEGHMDITIMYRIKCEHSLEGKEIRVFFIEKFPDLEKLNITLITSSRQENIVLDEHNNKVKL